MTLNPECCRDNLGVTLEQQCALHDVKCVAVEYGREIILRPRDEGNITRDPYNSIQRQNAPSEQYTVYAYPFDRDFNKYPYKKYAGVLEEVDYVAWIPRLFFTENNIGIETFDELRSTAIVGGRKYNVKALDEEIRIADIELYVLLALYKK